MARVWGELDLLVEQEANGVRSTAMAMFQAGAAIMSGKTKPFNKWLDGLG